MLKVLSVFLFTLLFSSSSVLANRYVMNHEKFIHLNESEKNEFIIKTMELMVELESKYEKAVINEGADSKKARRYSRILNELRSFLIPTAYAAPAGMPNYAEDFANLIELDNPNAQGSKCFYAGWISRTSKFSTINHRGEKIERELCIHPGRLPKSSPEHKAYAKNTSCKKPDPTTSSIKDEISCNPVIFGLKDKAKNKDFCVDSGASNAVNSSLNCMKLALSDENTTQDSREDRLKFLRSQLESEPALARNFFNFLSKACLCENPDLGSLSSMYASNVRPHRTCFALLNMMAETVNCAETEIEGLETGFIKKIKEHSISVQTPSSIDNFYNTFIGKLKTDNPTEYGRICKGEAAPVVAAQPEEKITCSATCTVIEGDTSKEGETKKLKCDYKAQNDKKPDEVIALETTSGEATEGQEIEVKLKGSEKTVKCTATAPVVEANEKAPECEITITNTDGAKEASVRAGNVEVTKVTWDHDPEATGSDIVIGEKVSVTGAKADLTDGKKEYKDVVCTLKTPEEKPEESNKDKPTVTVKEKAKQASANTYEANVTGDRTGWSIVWTKEGKEAGPIEGSETVVTVPNGKEAFKVCAQLTKGEEKSNKDCATSTPPKAAPAHNGPIMQNRIPSGPMRGNSGTSAYGIR